MSTKRTQIMITVEHDEGVDPSKWRWPKTTRQQIAGAEVSMAIVGAQVIDENGAEQDTKPALRLEHTKIEPTNVVATVALIIPLGDAKKAHGNLRDDLIGVVGENHSALAMILKPLLDGGCRVADVFFSASTGPEHKPESSQRFAANFEQIGDWMIKVVPVGSKATTDAPIIVRFLGGAIHEVAFPADYTGPALQVNDYDAGAQLSKNKPLPTGFQRDPIGAYKPEVHQPE